jgi:hypothetical protein
MLQRGKVKRMGLQCMGLQGSSTYALFETCIVWNVWVFDSWSVNTKFLKIVSGEFDEEVSSFSFGLMFH